MDGLDVSQVPEAGTLAPFQELANRMIVSDAGILVQASTIIGELETLDERALSVNSWAHEHWL